MTPSAALLVGCLVALLAPTTSGALSAKLRPPSIPLFTADPWMQTWVNADNGTADVVRYWDGAPMEMLGLVRVDGRVFRFLGQCGLVVPSTPGPVTDLPKHNVAPGSCDLANDQRPLAACNEWCYGTEGCVAYVVNTRGTCYLKSCASPTPADASSHSGILTGPRQPTCNDSTALVQDSVTVMPTKTVFDLRTPDGSVGITVTFQSSMFTDALVLLSRPVQYLALEAVSLDSQDHDVAAYFDASAQHVVRDGTQNVSWATFSTPSVRGTRMGADPQTPLDLFGDRIHLDWGYLYLGANSSTASFRGGSAADQRSAFAASGALPASEDTRKPRQATDDMPSLAVVDAVAVPGNGTKAEIVFLLAYDDVDAVFYFGSRYKGLWTQTYGNITNAMQAASADLAAVRVQSSVVDNEVSAALELVGGAKYAAVGLLAYRQTLAATKLVWNSDRNETWNFLKENGDMQTMDVIYPASPFFLYRNPDLLKLLLLPVLSYANNETYIRFTNPYSPHQLGKFPIANATPASQEPMPMENTGNMFLMLRGIVAQDELHNTSFFYPRFWPLLTSWADYLNASLPFPANQLCTDDFTGRLANNTNLAAKGIVALQAYAELCEMVSGANCQAYSQSASHFAEVFQHYAYEADPQPHYKIAYNVSNSWSLKYNLVWQKLLKMSGPFPDKVFEQETAFYRSKANAFGTPLDLRHTYVKLDWLSWAAAMADSQDFEAMFDPIFKYANETASRWPLSDLYDTVTGANSRSGFIARPVVGGVYAKMLLGF